MLPGRNARHDRSPTGRIARHHRSLLPVDQILERVEGHVYVDFGFASDEGRGGKVDPEGQVAGGSVSYGGDVAYGIFALEGDGGVDRPLGRIAEYPGEGRFAFEVFGGGGYGRELGLG